MADGVPPLYFVPSTLLDVYQGKDCIVRASSPDDVVRQLSDKVLQHVAYVRLLDAREDLEPLMAWAEGFPLEVVLQDPVRDLPRLYACAQIAARHPVRVVIPVQAGFGRAVHVAASLKLRVKLDFKQPNAETIVELLDVTNLYLHSPMCTEPIEFFHSLLLSIYNDDAQTLWTIQGEDPATDRWVNEDGATTTLREFPAEVAGTGKDASIESLAVHLSATGAECVKCPFLTRCMGYFKCPAVAYDCSGIKRVLEAIANAATELKLDSEKFSRTIEATSG